MSTVELTKDSFEEALKGSDIVLLDWWATWCGPCRQFAPVYEKASDTHADITFGKIDTDAQQELAAAAEITSIPTLMAFREGIMVFRQPGALPASALEQVITAVRDLDMNEVHAEIKKQQESGGAAPEPGSAAEG